MFVILSAEKNLNWFFRFSCFLYPVSCFLAFTTHDSRFLFHVKQKGGRPVRPPPLCFYALIASRYYVAKDLFYYLLFYLSLRIGRLFGPFTGWHADSYFLLVAVLGLPGASCFWDCLRG